MNTTLNLTPMTIKKRNGEVALWNRDKITLAVSKALLASGEGAQTDAAMIAHIVERRFWRAAGLHGQAIPSVEAVQDEVERQLMVNNYPGTAKHYILYRESRAKSREKNSFVPEHVRSLAARSKPHFPGNLSEFVYYRTYSRWMEKEGRRETWLETVQRYIDFMHEKLGDKLTDAEYTECFEAIANMEVMPSMRLMWAAGDAARASNVSGFNCSFIAPTCLQDFGEILYILACGTGVGFAAESRNVQQLPIVERQRGMALVRHQVGDSKEGWADALVLGLKTWYMGADIEFDMSGVRKEGARLKTMGGRASGPALLVDLLAFARGLVLSRQGRRLSEIDVHDLVCKIGECIVSGGVRRSALISLSDLDNDAMRDAKKGHFFMMHGHRELSNNSAVYEEKPDPITFMREWLALAESGSGERGIFNRGSLPEQVPERRLAAWAKIGAGEFIEDGIGGEFILHAQVGTNPCGEIYLLSKQFCNLTEVVCRAKDTPADLTRKVRIASILGTYQSMLTDFPYLSKEWKENCDAERLLGVSLTGQWDCKAILNDVGSFGLLLKGLARTAVSVNELYAERFGINPSTAVTCGKPSGTVSQLVDASSGGHPRMAPYYIRRIRISSTDALFKMLRDQGVPHEPENGQTREDARTFVFSFPVASPEGSRCAEKVSAIDQLNHWLAIKTHFTEHNPSVTIYVGHDEWWSVGNWVWNHWDKVGGLSFLPRNDHVYRQAPYEPITEEQYKEMVLALPDTDYSMIVAYEAEDETIGSKELACVAGVCELP